MATGNPKARTPQEAYAANMTARQLVISTGVDLIQQIDTQTFTDYTPGQRKILNTRIKPVGLLKRLYIHVTATLAGQTVGTLNRTALGGANIFSNVILTDLNNQVRVQTPGWHLHALATVRRGWQYNAAYAAVINTNVAAGSQPTIVGDYGGWAMGDNLHLMNVPVSVAAAATPTISWVYEVPVSYSDTDLTGAIWVNTQNASMNLQVEINPEFFVTSAQDPTMAVYQSSDADITGADITTMTVTVYQHVLDQLPRGQDGMVILPGMDLEKVYLLNNTDITGLTANVATAMPYANWRQFMSTIVLYDGNTSAGLRPATDITAFAVQSANFTDFFRVSPQILGTFTRNKLMADFPEGMWYLDHRNKPIVTQQYGNMELQITPIAPPTGAHFRVGYESIALQSVMNMAGSLFQG